MNRVAVFIAGGLLALGLSSGTSYGQGNAALFLRQALASGQRDSTVTEFAAKVGETINLELYMDAAGEAVTGVQILISYDGAVFQPVLQTTQGGGLAPFREGTVFRGNVTANEFADGDEVGNPNGNGLAGYQLRYIEVTQTTSQGQRFVSGRAVIATMQVRVLRRPASGSGTIQVDANRGDGATGYFRIGQAGNRINFNLVKNATVSITGFAIRPIPDVLLPPGGTTTINLNQYVDTNVTWSPAAVDSLTTTIDPQTNILTLEANAGFVGVRALTLSATTLAGGETAQTPVRVVVNTRPTIPAGSFPDTLRIVEDQPDSSFLVTGRARDPDSPTAPLIWTVSGGTSVGIRLSGGRVVLTPTRDFNGSERVKFVVTDQYGARDSTSMVVTVTPVNDPPEFFRQFPKLTISRDTTLFLNDYLRDVDNSLSDPNYLLIATTTDSILLTISKLKLTMTAIPGWPGDKKVTITAVDPDGGRASQLLNVTVTGSTGPPPPAGQAPIVKPPVPDKVGVVSGGVQVALPLDSLVTDPDTPRSQIRWTARGNTELLVNIDTSGGQSRAIIQAPATFLGFELLTFTATDPTNLSGSFQLLAFSVLPGIPDIGGLPDTSVVAGGRSPYVNFDDYMFDSNDPDSSLVVSAPVIPADLKLVIDPVTHRSSIEALATAPIGSRQVVLEVRNRANKTGLDTILVRVDPPGLVRLSDFPAVTFRSDQFGALRLDDYVLSGGHSRLVWTPQFNATRLTVTIDANRVATFRAVGGFAGQDIVTLTARDPGTNSQSVGTVLVTVQPQPVTITLKPLPNVSYPSGATDRSLKLNNFVENAADTSRLVWSSRLLSGRTNTVTVFVDPTTHFVTFGSSSGFTGQETVVFTARAGVDSASTSTLVTVTPAGSTAGVLRLVTIANALQRAFVDVFVTTKQELASDPTVIVELNGERSLISMRKISVERVGDIWNGNLALRVGKSGAGRLLASAVTKLQVALTDTARFTVGVANPGFALTVSAPGASLTMPPGAFREASVVALFQTKDGDPGNGASKPAGPTLIPASEAYTVILSEDPAEAGEIRFEVLMGDGQAAGQAGVYRKDGDRWVQVGGRISEAGGLRFVSAPVLQGGVYRVMVTSNLGPDSPFGGAAGEREGVPRSFEISQNYPNPFNPATSIRLSLPTAAEVSVRVYDLSGRLVRTLFSGDSPAGNVVVTWDGKDGAGRRAASGVYLYRLEAPGVGVTKKMMLLK